MEGEEEAEEAEEEKKKKKKKETGEKEEAEREEIIKRKTMIIKITSQTNKNKQTHTETKQTHIKFFFEAENLTLSSILTIQPESETFSTKSYLSIYSAIVCLL